MDFREYTLDNGLQLIAEVNPRAYSMAVGFFVDAGSRDETDEKHGHGEPCRITRERTAPDDHGHPAEQQVKRQRAQTRCAPYPRTEMDQLVAVLLLEAGNGRRTSP